jgi:hypothetical protein
MKKFSFIYLNECGFRKKGTVICISSYNSVAEVFYGVELFNHTSCNYTLPYLRACVATKKIKIFKIEDENL